jgi:hypothetical protein
LVSAWVAQLARDERLDPALLATRADIVAFLRGDADARLNSGWRNELVGDGIRRLVGGEAGLTFDPEGQAPVARPLRWRLTLVRIDSRSTGIRLCVDAAQSLIAPLASPEVSAF